jgi:hypothetical protein
MSYEGKEPCQGCGKSGSERFRWEKNALCPTCSEIFKKGSKMSIEEEQKYVSVRQHYFGFSGLDFDDNMLNNACIEMLKSIHNPYAKPIRHEEMSGYKGDNRILAIIPEKFFEPIKVFCFKMQDYTRKIREEKERIPGMAKLEVQKEKSRIYNEGIEKGRNLLLQLNLGEISSAELNNNHSYSEEK